MGFFLIGLGLGDPRDVTVQGLEVIKQCTRVYLEAYTSIMNGGKENLEAFYGREVIVADREQVEQGSDGLFEGAREGDVALLVVGDSLGATTHTDLKLRAHQLNIPVQVISNVSIINAIGCCGLNLDKFGETVSIPFWLDGWEPISFADKINRNLRKNLHTLCLLDIKVKEQSLENLLRGRRIYEPPRYMRVNQAASQLLQILQRRNGKGEDKNESEQSEGEWLLTPESVCIAVVRIGTETQHLAKATLQEMSEIDFGEPLHSMIICSECKAYELEQVDKICANYDGKQAHKSEKENTPGTLHLIGLGLGAPSDITVKGLDFVKSSVKVYLDSYSSLMTAELEDLQSFYGREVILATRDLVENQYEEIFRETSKGDIAFLVVGDPLCATKHVQFMTAALDKQIPVNVVHNASIFNAVGCCGLQLYSFGEVVSIPYWKGGDKQEDFYDKICSNLENGWHTLVLVDIREDKNGPQYMTAAEAASQLLSVISSREAESKVAALTKESTVIGLSKVGSKEQQLRTCMLQEMANSDFGGPPHSLVIVGETHPMEDEYIDIFKKP
ncbi:unnamed protein product, partial [Meganyctiphanes norvegica]